MTLLGSGRPLLAGKSRRTVPPPPTRHDPSETSATLQSGRWNSGAVDIHNRRMSTHSNRAFLRRGSLRLSVLRNRGRVRCGLEHVIEFVTVEIPTANEDGADLARVMDIVEEICVQQKKISDLALFDGAEIL
jgi:hypothetical protein